MRAVAARASAAPAPRRAARTVKAARNVRVQSGDAYGASGTSFYTTTEKQGILRFPRRGPRRQVQ